ncbi:hypothetical protein, partial [Enterococcus faecium]|uniref:hypothetical protein n=1 Tax=Enterococcus faecium TaxID=1352 RepID=UPI001E5989BC
QRRRPLRLPSFGGFCGAKSADKKSPLSRQGMLRKPSHSLPNFVGQKDALLACLFTQQNNEERSYSSPSSLDLTKPIVP